jgi:hypothetical protein
MKRRPIWPPVARRLHERDGLNLYVALIETPAAVFHDLSHHVPDHLLDAVSQDRLAEFLEKLFLDPFDCRLAQL